MAARPRIAACVGALVDFATTGGPAADIWFNAIRSSSLDARDRRAEVLIDIAPSSFTTAMGPACIPPTPELLVLGGILEIRSIRLRNRNRLSNLHAKAELVSLVWTYLG